MFEYTNNETKIAIDNLVKTTKSIDLSISPNFVIGTSGTNSFKWIIDAQKCVIYGQNITKTTAGSSLFCALWTGEISNVTVDGEINGQHYTG